MTELLKKAFREAERLTPEEQDALAQTLLEEFASEAKWQGTLSEVGHDALERLADEAIEEHAGRRTTPLDPDAF